MRKRCEENENSDDSLGSIAKDIKDTMKEMKHIRDTVSAKLYQSRLIDKKYALYRNRYILRTGEEPDMSILKELYTDVSFLKPASQEVAEGSSEVIEESVPASGEGQEVEESAPRQEAEQEQSVSEDVSVSEDMPANEESVEEVPVNEETIEEPARKENPEDTNTSEEPASHAVEEEEEPMPDEEAYEADYGSYHDDYDYSDYEEPPPTPAADDEESNMKVDEKMCWSVEYSPLHTNDLHHLDVHVVPAAAADA